MLCIKKNLPICNAMCFACSKIIHDFFPTSRTLVTVLISINKLFDDFNYRSSFINFPATKTELHNI